ncbi:hypothetical protein HS125_08455 [bacterium]|nr:hypothetical protein [bacterium]
MDPLEHNLLFERFCTAAQGHPRHRHRFRLHRRAEIIAWMEETFGQERRP